MARLIDADALREFLIRAGRFLKAQDDRRSAAHAIGKIIEHLDRMPTVDAVEVVRCDACDWHVDVGYHYCNKWCVPCPDNADFFCAYGERPNCGADMREES